MMRFHLFTALLLLCTACASIDEEGEKTRPHKMLHTARGHIHLIAAPEAGGGVRADQPGATDREIGRMESEIGRMESEIRRMESEIRRMEYSYRPFNEDGEVIWSAPNRALGMRTRVTAAGIEIFPRATRRRATMRPGNSSSALSPRAEGLRSIVRIRQTSRRMGTAWNSSGQRSRNGS